MEMDTLLDVCGALEAIRSSSILRYILLSTVIWSVIAIPVNAVVIAATCKHNLVHYNIKWIIVTHLLCLIVHNIARIVNHMWDLINFSNTAFDCSFLPDPSRCVAVRLPSHVTMYLSFSTTFMLSVERSIATYNLASYDRNRTVGPFLVFVQVLIAAAFIGAIYMWYELQRSLVYCLFAIMTSMIVLYIQIIVFLAFQVLAIIIFHFLLKFNTFSFLAKFGTNVQDASKKQILIISLHESKLTRKGYQMSVALQNKIKVKLLTEGSKRLFSKGQVITKLYQVRENLKTMETLFLFFLVCCFVSFASNAFRGVVHWYKPVISQPTYIGLIELSIPIPPYSVVLPAVLWYSYRRVRRKIAEDHCNIRDLNTTPNINRSHFKVLKETWK